ncbi:hypothetical protein ACFWPQ_47690 [Streptomyces sp. NPDC058464]|uniref:hypothetical protein n=1 Tax=Streptomyces sp. NPDC058464 TaxID=3346511 RepID=UPI003650B0F5
MTDGDEKAGQTGRSTIDERDGLMEAMEWIADGRPDGASYDGGTRTWTTWSGALDLPNVARLQTLFDAACTYGTDVRLEHAPVPAGWTGPVSTADPEMASLLTAKADGGRRLGELPVV